MIKSLDLKRIESLEKYKILDTLPEKEYDDIVLLAASICNAEFSAISLLDLNRQFSKACFGGDVSNTPISLSICTHAILEPEEIFIVEDLRIDERFYDHPFVIGEPFFSFYAGMPLVTSDNVPLGTLCVLDSKSKKLKDNQITALKTLAKQVMNLLDLRKAKLEAEEHKIILKQETERLNNIIEASRAGTWEWNFRTSEININKRWAEMLGYTLVELQPCTIAIWEDLLHPEDSHASLGTLEQTFDYTKYLNLEFRLIHKKGHEVWIESRGRVITWTEDGHPLIMSGTHIDITERKYAELHSKVISDNLPGAVIIFKRDTNGIYTFPQVSKGVLKLCGIPSEDIMKNSGLVWGKILTEDLEGFFASIEQSAKDLSYWEYAWRFYHIDGSLRWNKGSGNPSKTSDGSVIWNVLVLDVSEEKKSQILAEKRAKDIQKIMDSSFDVICTIDRNGHIQNINAACERTLGYKPEAMIGSHFTDFLYSADLKITLTAVSNIKNCGAMSDLENRYIRRDGSIVPFIWSGRWDQSEELMFCVARDATEKKQAEANLLLSERRFRSLVQEGSDLIGVLDISGIYKYVSPTSSFILDITPEEFVGKNALDFIHPDDIEYIQEAFSRLETEKRIALEPYRFLNKIGEWRWMETIVTNMIEDSVIGGLVTNSRDITENFLIRQNLQESNERFEKVTQATNDAIWDWDLVNQTLHRGEGFKTLFGHEKCVQPPSIENWKKNIHTDDSEAALKSLKAVLADADSNKFELEFRYLKADGSAAHVIDRGLIIRTADGTPTRIVGAMTDVTSIKEYERSLKMLNEDLCKYSKELELSNAELEQFAYVASHDLQEPLRMVTSFLTQLEKKYKHKLDDKANQYIHFAVDGAVRMRQIILDLLSFSRVGKWGEEEREIINVNDLIEDYIRLRKKLIYEKSANVVIENLPIIHNLKTPLIQVFNNLIDNALKYSKPNIKPEIVISAKEEEESFIFSIKDNGIGIQREYHDKIFIIFQRLHDRSEYSGTGMGLAIVKKIIENLGGDIWVDSEEKIGSTFYIRIYK